MQQLSRDEVEGLRHIFSDLDADGSGQLTPTELRDGLRRRGLSMTPEEMGELMKARAAEISYGVLREMLVSCAR